MILASARPCGSSTSGAINCPVTCILITTDQNRNVTHLFLIGEIGDFSKNVKLTYLYLNRNNFTGNVHSDHQRSESKCDWFILGEIGDFSKCTALQKLWLDNNNLSGNVHSDHHTSESKCDWFILGEIGDFSNNVNLVELSLGGNRLSGNVHSDHQRSESKPHSCFFDRWNWRF